MIQRALHRTREPLHVAIIMDGNGRWATMRGLPRTAGHRAGADAVRRVVEAAPGLGIGTLTLYAFSSDNWKRPRAEIGALMSLFRAHLRSEAARCVENGVRLRVVGRTDRLSASLRAAVAAAESATAAGTRLELRLAIDYSARDLIVAAAARCGAERASRADFARCLGEAMRAGGESAEVDLLIRTGGERRLSDFLLWECAYAELCFQPTMWPDFGAAELRAALEDFGNRERRFGRIPAAVAG